MSAMNTQRMMKQTTVKFGKLSEKLSSGLRINRGGDDAAGLAISEKMRAQIRGLKQQARNVLDSISLIQTTDGALQETHSILQRMRELCIQAANGTNIAKDRENIQKEINQLTGEVDRIAENTEFNTIKILNQGDDVRTLNQNFYINKSDGTAFHINYYLEENKFSGWASASAGDNDAPAQEITAEQYEQYKTVIDNVIDGIVNKGWLELAEGRIAQYYGLTGATVSDIKPNIRVNFLVDTAYGTLASVSSTASNNGSSVVAKDFVLNIDLADFTPGSGDSGDNTLTNGGMDMYNDRILAHEMVHAYLAQYITTEQVGSYGNVPTWFNEGVAELIHGADERLFSLAGDTLESGEISSYMEAAAVWDGKDQAYAGGYLMVRAIQENGTDGMDTLKKCICRS